MAVRAVHAVFAILAVHAVLAIIAIMAPNAVFAVVAVRAVDVAILIGDENGVGGNGSVLVFHGFFSYKLVGVACQKW